MFSFNQNSPAPLWHNGPKPGAFYNFPDNGAGIDLNSHTTFGSQRSAQPITTGTSVVGLVFDDGVIIAADRLVSYGSLARFQDVDRVFKINEKTVIGCGGDYADFQCIKRYIDDKTISDICYNDNITLKPKSLYNCLTRVLYNRRSRFNPLWIDMIVGGIEEGKPFLGHIDLRGRSYQDKIVVTGFGKHLAVPLLREYVQKNASISEEQAVAIMKKCMEVLFYRDCRASPNYSLAICTKGVASVKGPFTVDQNWEFAKNIKGY